MSAIYEFHELSDLFPMMSQAEYAELKRDIAENGLVEPILLYKGQILDGRNRYKACTELGVPLQTKELENGVSPLSLVISLNLKRRHLTASQRAVLADEIRPLFENEARKRQLSQLKQFKNTVPALAQEREEESETAEKAAAVMDVGPRTVYEVASIREKAPELIPDIKEGRITVKEATRQVKKQEKQKAVEKASAEYKEDESVTLLHGDIWEAAKEVPDESVDLILTDPPYGKEHLALYDYLAAFAGRVLKPGGSLLVLTGQSYLPEIYYLMSPDLEPGQQPFNSLDANEYESPLKYQWTLAYLTPGGQSPTAPLSSRRVNSFWKPVLWFVKGEYKGDVIGDVIKSDVNDNDKEHHRWGQSESGIARLLERFSMPGEIVLDPFLGGGTTAVVAKRLKRKFIGIDIDESCIKETRARLAEGVHLAAV